MSQKMENLLNLALDATPEELRKSQELDVGYITEANEWELIIKYSGSLDRVREVSVSVTELLNGYAVVIVREPQIEVLAGLPEVDFIEKPKSLFFEAENGRRTSCIDAVQAPPFSLSGQGVLVGIVDRLCQSGFQKRGRNHPDCSALGSVGSRKSAGGI